MLGVDEAEWAAQQVRGPKVAWIGRSVAAPLVALAREGHEVAVYVSDPSAVDQWMDAGVPDDGSRVELRHPRCLGKEPETAVNTVVVFGWPDEDDLPYGVCGAARRLLSSGGRLVLVQPDFSRECLADGGFDIASFINDVREFIAPVQLSLGEDTLRFVGECGPADAGTWGRFEQSVWPGLLLDAIRSVTANNRREVAGLEQRLGRLRELLSSTSYRVGRAVVTNANRPLSLWRLPRTLWHMYRARPSRPSAKATETRQRVVFPRLPLPLPTSTRPVVAAVLDTFSDYCLRYELDLVRLTPNHWRREIEAVAPAFLLVESAWAGNGGRWRNLVVHNDTLVRNPLRDLVTYCRANGIRTVFWNKEDPPNFDFYIAAAKQFDIVFTSDVDCVPRYRNACGHDRVHVMPFAAQPKIHNPCRDRTWPRYPVCFAGSWRGDAYEKRNESISGLLDPALEFGLHIMDRNLRRTDTRPYFRFPDRYREAIKGSLTYEEMLTAYRCYDVMLNANTVTESPTMFSRRVFESLACATPVVSLESIGIRAMLGEHVRVARTPEETAAYLRTLLGDDEARVREGHLAYRFVHENHTYRHRVESVFREAGLAPVSRSRSTVSVIALLRDIRRLENVLGEFARQSYREKNLLVFVAGNDIDIDEVELRLRGIDDAASFDGRGFGTFGRAFNQAMDEVSGTYIAVFDDSDSYGECYISDMMLAADFSSAEVLGKGSYYSHDPSHDTLVLENEGMDHRFVDSIAMATIVAVRDALCEIGLGAGASGLDASLLARVSRQGYRIYSADRFNYLNVSGEPTGTVAIGVSTGHDDLTVSRVMI